MRIYGSILSPQPTLGYEGWLLATYILHLLLSEFSIETKAHFKIDNCLGAISPYAQTARFSNGWIVKMGRGLDYFQKPEVMGIIETKWQNLYGDKLGLRLMNGNPLSTQPVCLQG